MSEFGKIIIENLLPVMGALLTALSTYAVRLIAAKLKIQVAAEEEAMLRYAIRKGIAGAEEWAARKASINPSPIKGADKALWVSDRIKEMYPNIQANEITRLIDEELASIKGVGATGDKHIEA